MSGFLCSMVGVSPAAAAAAFVSPTAEFTNDANTKLLLHFNGTNGATTTTDDNIDRTAITVTANGNAQVDTAQSKFGGASALFDGTGDYLLIDSSNSSSLNFGTGNFTLEFFARATVRDQFHTIIANNKSSWTAGSVTLLGGSGSTSTTALRLAANSFNSGGAGIVYDNQAMTTGVWYHYAITRSGNDFTMYRDGTSVSTGTFSGSINLGEDGTRIGYTRWDGDVSTWDGHIDEIRISNSVRYTTTFTPTAAAFTNDTNTLLLIHADGTDASTTFTDDNTSRTAKVVTLTTSSLNTTTKKFGTASLSVDGTGGDRATIPDTGDVDLQAAPRTFECWVYINSFTNASRNSPDHLPKLMGHMDQGGNIYWTFGPNTEQGISFYYWSGGNNWVHSTKKDLVTGQWYHMALIVTATGAKGYVDGVEYVSSALSNTPTAGNTIFSIGSEFGQSMNAYIDEVRISHVNRYT